MTDKFFEAQSEQSKVKALIVSEYFQNWSQVMKSNVNNWGNYFGTDKIVYLDLYSGPGTYEDGSYSTPILIVQNAIEKLADKFYGVFNDADEESIKKLESTILALPGIEKLKFAPKFYTGEVDADLTKTLQQSKIPPTLMFADPFGYKGLTLDLINSVLKDFGGESIFFFNYNRTQAAIKNSIVEKHMDALFGKDRADKLRELEKGVDDKETEILLALIDGLLEKFGQYFCLFRFPSVKRNMTSHYLFYVTKHKLGFQIMQSVMAKHSDDTDQFGIASFECKPGATRQPSLFNPLEELGKKLSEKYKGRTLKLDDFWTDDAIATNYVRKNFVEAVKLLHDRSMVSFEGQVPAKRAHCGEKTFIKFL